MADKTLSQVLGNGGSGFAETFFSGQQVAAASMITGDLITITPPSGERVRLTHLQPSATATKTNISITIGAKTVVSGLTLDDIDGVGVFVIGTSFVRAGATLDLTGDIDEQLVVNVGDATNNDLYYAYKYGV